MATALSELVHFVGEETALVLRAKKAVEWVASKPEGHAVLEAAKKLHGDASNITKRLCLKFLLSNTGTGLRQQKMTPPNYKQF